MRVNGLFGWVRRNDARSALFLLGFALLSQPMAMVVLFVPLVFFDSEHAPWYAWGGYAQRYAPVVALAAVAYYFWRMWRDIHAVRRDIGYRLVDRAAEPRLCNLVEPLAIAAGVRAPGVGVIEVPEMNAFACGVTADQTVLVFTRGLIEGLDDDELSAVIAHELVHVGNGDTRLIASANVFMRGLALLERINILKPRRYRQAAVVLIAPILFPVYLGVALLAQLFVRLGHASRLLIASSREFVADAEAVRLTQNPEALVSALRRIAGRSALPGLALELDAMMIDGAAVGALATHPTLTERIEAIVAMTGAMALDGRPRRDTRTALELRRAQAARAVAPAFAAETATPNEARRLARIAVTASAPKQSSLEAFFRVGRDGHMTVFGLRWDIAAAFLATFVTAAILNHGDLLGYLGRMGHALDRPTGDTKWLIDKAKGCRKAEARASRDTSATDAAFEACDWRSKDFADHAKRLGFNVLPDGRVLTDAQLAMLSPEDIADSMAFDPHPKNVGWNISKGEPVNFPPPMEAATDLAPSYPLPLHEAWTRLAQGDLGFYLGSVQCGLLIHIHVDTEQDRAVTWRITSEGVEQVRFVARLTAEGDNATRVSLEIVDRQLRRPVLNARDPNAPAEPVTFRPAVSAPLRPAFAEAISALLEQRLFNISRVTNGDAWAAGDGMSAGMCSNQRDRLARGEHFSFHDREAKP